VPNNKYVPCTQRGLVQEDGPELAVLPERNSTDEEPRATEALEVLGMGEVGPPVDPQAFK